MRKNFIEKSFYYYTDKKLKYVTKLNVLLLKSIYHMREL